MRALEALATLVLFAGCGGGLPAPPYVEHPGTPSQVVPSMPPPGKVEVVPPRPKDMKHPIWLDGEWEWSGRRWTWKEHGWQEAPPGASYALPTTKRLPDGRIVYLPGVWKKDAPPP